MQPKRFTRRNTVLAGIAAVVLIGGGTVSAVAFSGGSTEAGSSAEATADTQRGQGGEGSSSLDREDRVDVRISPAAAVDRVLKAMPGDITELELDHDDGRYVWEADVLAQDGGWHEVTLDADSGKLLDSHAEHSDSAKKRAKHQEKAKRVAAILADDHTDVRDALSTTAKYGKANEIELERTKSGKAGAVWEVETADDSGVQREILVSVADGKIQGIKSK